MTIDGQANHRDEPHSAATFKPGVTLESHIDRVGTIPFLYSVKSALVATWDPTSFGADEIQGADSLSAGDEIFFAEGNDNADPGVYVVQSAGTLCAATKQARTWHEGQRVSLPRAVGSQEYKQTSTDSAAATFEPSDPFVKLQQQVAGMQVLVDALMASSATKTFGSPEERKASEIPVSGALVLAPMSQSRRNYGSLDVTSLTDVGTPKQYAFGATVNGVDSALHINTGYKADFTATFRARTTNKQSTAIVSVNQAAPGTAGFKGWGVARGSTNWILGAVGVASIDSGVAADDNWHTFTLKRDAGTTTLYLDGTAIATTTAGSTGGTHLMIGVTQNSGLIFQYWTACASSNVVMFASALSDGDRALVEAYVSAGNTDRVSVAAPSNAPQFRVTDHAWMQTQVNEPCIKVDPRNPNQLVAYYSANGAQGWCVGRATAPISDPTNWTQYAGNPIHVSGAYSHRLDSWEHVDGVDYFYLTSQTNNNIDLYTSTDGTTLARDAASPVLTATGQGRNDGSAVCQGAVLYERGVGWHMAYSRRGALGQGTDNDLGSYRYAFAQDGKTWTKNATGQLVAITDNTPWAKYLEWHKLDKVGDTYVLLGECYDGKYWTVCMFYGTSFGTGVTFTPVRSSPLFSQVAEGKNTATPAIFAVNGQHYIAYQESQWAQNYATQKWNMAVAVLGASIEQIIAR